MKTYEQFVNNDVYKIYHGGGKDVYVYDELGDMTMDYIFVVDGNRNVKGFATRGFYTEEMEEKGVHTIGTIGGPHMGKYLYDGFISYFGKICPTSNESDQAKKSWKKKFDSPDYIKEKIEGIGYYWRYPEEEYLNTVYDVKKKVDVEELPYNKQNKDIYDKLEKMYKDFHVTDDKYTIGQSRVRDTYLTEQGKNPENEPYKNEN